MGETKLLSPVGTYAFFRGLLKDAYKLSASFYELRRQVNRRRQWEERVGGRG